MRSAANNAAQNNTLIAMRAKTAKLNPASSALHLMASGVVDQIMTTETKAAGSDIPFLQKTKLPFLIRSNRTNGTNKKATDYFCGLLKITIANIIKLILQTTLRAMPLHA